MTSSTQNNIKGFPGGAQHPTVSPPRTRAGRQNVRVTQCESDREICHQRGFFGLANIRIELCSLPLLVIKSNAPCVCGHSLWSLSLSPKSNVYVLHKSVLHLLDMGKIAKGARWSIAHFCQKVGLGSLCWSLLPFLLARMVKVCSVEGRGRQDRPRSQVVTSLRGL